MKRAFAHLNLTRNPFGEPERSERAALAVVDVDAYAACLVEGGCYVEFTGRQGRGKSTRLHVLHDQLEEAVFIRIPEDSAAAAAVEIPRSKVLLVDDGQFLSSEQRRQVFARSDSVAAATHESLVSHARWAGFEVRDVEVGGVDPGQLRAIAERRIEWARRDPGPVPGISDSAIERLIELFGDDLRTIEDVLYSFFQELDEAEDVRVEDIERADVPEYTFT